MTEEAKPKDALREKLDALAIDILERVSVDDDIEQTVLKAMDALTTVGKWYAIKNKVIAAGGDDEEGAQINDYRKALKREAVAGRDGQSDAEVAGDAPEPLRIGPSRDPAGKPNRHRGGGRSPHADDADAGGPDLDRILASLPINVGGANGNQHDSSHQGAAANGSGGSGGAGVEGDGESDLDEFM